MRPRLRCTSVRGFLAADCEDFFAHEKYLATGDSLRFIRIDFWGNIHIIIINDRPKHRGSVLTQIWSVLEQREKVVLLLSR